MSVDRNMSKWQQNWQGVQGMGVGVSQTVRFPGNWGDRVPVPGV